jgi:molybdopterin-guanine dinucleotide biosynthesis protein A
MQIVADGKEEISDGIHFPQLHICDLHPGEGPLAGIEAALATRFGSGYIIIACDQPRLDKAILKRLVGGHPDRIHAFEVGGDIVPLPLYVPQSAWGVMVKVMQGDNRSIRHFIEAGKYKLIPLLASEAPLLQSVNTPEEYQELLAELTAPTSGMQTLTREILP